MEKYKFITFIPYTLTNFFLGIVKKFEMLTKNYPRKNLEEHLGLIFSLLQCLLALIIFEIHPEMNIEIIQT